MKIDAVILGASGYGGGELLYWLSRHPHVASVHGTSRSRDGQPLASVHPNLRGVVEGRFESAIPWHDLETGEQPVIFSALPHGELKKSLGGIESESANVAKRMLLIDLSGDFRVSDERFVYGLPEWNRDALKGAKRIASPGCFATALQLALLPLRGLNVGFIAATAVTGSSGSGASASAGTHHPTRAHDLRAYKVLAHQHMAEVEMAMRACKIDATLGFVPQSGPFVRGIFATLQFALSAKWDATELQTRIAGTFEHCPFVRVLEESPRLAAVVGSNFADLNLVTNESSAAIMVALDNLGKGMASQAVQSMNIALGLNETEGLWQPGRFPG